MRLSQEYINTIKQFGKEIFGNQVKIYLFGSRVDDSKKGGDIDLYIIPEDDTKLYKKSIEYNVKLQKELGEQKIDIIVSKDKNDPIEQEAINKGIEL